MNNFVSRIREITTETDFPFKNNKEENHTEIELKKSEREKNPSGKTNKLR